MKRACKIFVREAYGGCASTEGHTDLSDLHDHLRPWWCPGPCSPWWPCLRSYCSWGLCDVYGCLNVHGLCFTLKPYWCPWSMLLLKAMLIWVPWAATWIHVDVCDLGYLQGSCLGPWFYCSWGPWPWCALSPETMRKSLIHAPADYKEQW